jgi:transcription-repair coupling factor (superfamily II helicase)
MAIQTIVAKFDEKLVRTAIEMELDRGGQVYFVHNRVETIYDLAAKIRELVPQARIVIGHGQLPEAELERVMLSFMNHEYDVLVATSIIENGLDIPLANTIIINRADRHGLSELYQLRGRVGRSNRRAYAYLLIPPDTELTEIARRRLAALKEFSDLGAGFKIAALDLELRGAGNMLGGEQSGHIEAIGFELYTSMLEEAVRKMKGEVDKPAHAGTSINLGISVRIDSAYIPEENQRLRMYKRIAGAEDEAALRDVMAELKDRYGDPPESVLNLLAAAELRLMCEHLGITQLDRKRTQIELPNPNGNKKQPLKQFVEMLHIRFGADAADSSQQREMSNGHLDPVVMMRLVARNAKRGAQFTPQGVLRWPLTSAKAAEVMSETRGLLEALAATTISA